VNALPADPLAAPLADRRIAHEPFYRPSGDECEQFAAAYARRLPLLLTGPTGCGKTRFVEHMAWRLGLPLVTVACHDDLTASDLTGRWLLDAEGTRWQDGPLTLAARHGALCYLDELIEARADTAVVIHPLTDTRRLLPLERRGEVLPAHPAFSLVASYNPGGSAKELKASTRQRFCGLRFSYPAAAAEAAIIVGETGIEAALATRLVEFATRTRRLQEHGLHDGASTRMLVHCAQLIREGITPASACRLAVVTPLGDDPEIAAALTAAADACF
jgi:nitric oxide reductase NorQ protein